MSKDRHDFSRPVRLNKRPKKKKKNGNGVHPPNRGHGAQTKPRRTAVAGAEGNTLRSQGLTHHPFQKLHQKNVEEAQARRARIESLRQQAAQDAREARTGLMTQEERELVSAMTRALRENTDTLREVHGLPAIDRDAVPETEKASPADDSEPSSNSDAEEFEGNEDNVVAGDDQIESSASNA